MPKTLVAVAVSASSGPPTPPQAEPGTDEWVFGVCAHGCGVYILVIVMFWGFMWGQMEPKRASCAATVFPLQDFDPLIT